MRRVASPIVYLLACGAMSCAPESSDSSFIVEGEPAALGDCIADPTDAPFADCIDAFEPAEDAGFGHDQLPDIVLGPPQGDPGGSKHVASLGCGGRITLYFDPPIIDIEGQDFIVFENAFATGDTTFAEPARVLVSPDGTTWSEFPCILEGDGVWPPTGCAGVGTVLSNDGTPDPSDAQLAGGDAFDLGKVGVDEARYVRLIDASEAYFGNTTWCTGNAGGFDLDAIAVVGEGSP